MKYSQAPVFWGPLHRGHLIYGLFPRPAERRITPSKRGLQSPIHNKHTYAISETPAGGGVLTTPFAVNELSRGSIPLGRRGLSKSALGRSLAVRCRCHYLGFGVSSNVGMVFSDVKTGSSLHSREVDDQVSRTRAAVLNVNTSLLWCRVVEKSRRGVVKLGAS